MKSIYRMPNMKNITLYISNICDGHHGADMVPHVVNNISYRHPYLIVSISKEHDEHLIPDMTQALAMLMHKLTDTTLIETQRGYYLSTSVRDLLNIGTEYNPENAFIRAINLDIAGTIGSILFNSQTPKLDSLFSKDRLNYPLYYNPKLEFQILNDMKFFSYDFMQLLTYTDLTRLELAELYRMTIRLTVPIYLAKELTDRFNLITTAKYTKRKIEHGHAKSSNQSELHFKLSKLAHKANLDASKVDFSTSPEAVLNLIDTIKSLVDVQTAAELTTMSSYVDLFITLNLSTLISFMTLKTLQNRSSYIFTRIIDTLIYNNKSMEYILTGVERS